MSILSTIKKKATDLYNKAVKATTPKKAAPKPAPKPVAKKAPTPAKKPAPKKVATPAKKPVTPQPSVMDKVQATAGKLGNYMKSNVQAKQAERNTGKFSVPTKTQVAKNNATMDMLNASTLVGAGVQGAKTAKSGIVNKAVGAVKGVTGLHKEASANYLKYGTDKYSTAADVIAKNTTGKGLMDKANKDKYNSLMMKGLAVDLVDPASFALGGVGKVTKGLQAISKGSKAAKAVDKTKDVAKAATQLDFLGKAKTMKTGKTIEKASDVKTVGKVLPAPTAKAVSKIPSPLPGASKNYENIASRGKGYMPAMSKQVGNPVGLPTPKPSMATPKVVNGLGNIAQPAMKQANNLPVPKPMNLPTPRPNQMPTVNPGAVDNMVGNANLPQKGLNFVIDGDRQMRAGAGFMDEAAQYGKPKFADNFGATNPVNPNNIPPFVNPNQLPTPNMAQGANQMGNVAQGMGQIPPNLGQADNLLQGGQQLGNVAPVRQLDNASTPNIPNPAGQADSGLKLYDEGTDIDEVAKKNMLNPKNWPWYAKAGAGAAALYGVGSMVGNGEIEEPVGPITEDAASGGGKGSRGRSGGGSGGSGGGMGGGGGTANTGMPELDATPVDQADYMNQVAGIMDQFMNNDPVMQQMLGQLPNGGAIGQDVIQNPVNPADPNAPQKPTTGYQDPNMNWDAINNAVATGGMTVEQATAEINTQLKPQYDTGVAQVKQAFMQKSAALKEDLASRGLLNSGVAAQLEMDLMKMESDSLAAFTAEHNGKVLDYAMQNMQLDQQKTQQLQQLYMSQKQIELDSYFKQMDHSLNLQQLSQQQQAMYMDYYQNMKMYAFQTMMDMVKKSMPDYNYYVSQKTSGGNYNFNYN